MTRTLVIDTGTHAVGAYLVEDDRYFHFSANRVAQDLLPMVQEVEELVTFNGWNRDLLDLAKFGGMPDVADLVRCGKHTDMLSVCWDNPQMFGKSLRGCYQLMFDTPPINDDGPYECSIELDVRMTFLLWKSWNEGGFPSGAHVA